MSSTNPDCLALLADDFLEEQVGGGRRNPSPPPYQTPMWLRTTVKAMDRDSSLVREAQGHQGHLLDHQASVPSSEHDEDLFLSKPVSCHAADNTSQTITHCTSQLFHGAQNACDNSPFPPREDKTHGASSFNSRPPVSRGCEASAQTGVLNSMHVLPQPLQSAAPAM
ncbi:hypothetical protein PAXRUDRAFT_154955 [Paxillus rubicundulus Ve08.2h10]|uniref:Uncharacterized protein n=1 Tax=Paxillus rubicundulus Ve08.2h10 TaxID=930991 RepID=A0A0D0D1H6_9AGAM|nr:hypothetical protein PAXRUDRAFT_154955 [Paxillus rubicundulus Ve08.2h10]